MKRLKLLSLLVLALIILAFAGESISGLASSVALLAMSGFGIYLIAIGPSKALKRLFS